MQNPTDTLVEKSTNKLHKIILAITKTYIYNESIKIRKEGREMKLRNKVTGEVFNSVIRVRYMGRDLTYDSIKDLMKFLEDANND